MKINKNETNMDVLFRIIVYLVAIYFISIKNSIPINIVGWIILFSHLYKDFTNLQKWPFWCEYIGIILAIILIYYGYQINNLVALLIGFLKLIAHFRQLVLKDNRYYY